MQANINGMNIRGNFENSFVSIYVNNQQIAKKLRLV